MTEQKTEQRTLLRNKLRVVAFFLTLSGLLLGAFGLVVTRLTRPPSPYRPLPPRTGFFSSQAPVDTTTRQEYTGFSQNELLVVFQDEIKDSTVVVNELLLTAPDDVFTSHATKPPTGAAAAEKYREKLAALQQKAQIKEVAVEAPKKEAAVKNNIVRPSVKQVQTAGPKSQELSDIKNKYPNRSRRAPTNAAVAPRHWERIELSSSLDVEKFKKHLLNDQRVKSVSLNRFYETFAENLQQKEKRRAGTPTASDPFLNSTGSWGQPYGDLWGLQNTVMDAVGAWPIEDGDPSIVVAVVDTGLDYNHEDIAANVWVNSQEIPDNAIDDDSNGFVDDVRGYDFTTCEEYGAYGCVRDKPIDNNPMDDNGHGTHVAGTVAAVRNNNLGIAGVCPTCRIMPVKGLNAQGAGDSIDLANAIRYAADNGADIINMSWGGLGVDTYIQDALDYAHAAGVLLVAAAGNSSSSVQEYSFFPAIYEPALTVSASDPNDHLAPFSNFGAIDVAAPGVDILSLRAAGTDPYGNKSNFVPRYDPNAKYELMSGTSMAAPHVAGLVGLMLSKGMASPITQAKMSAEDINNNGWDGEFGSGRVSARRALTIATDALQAVLTQPSMSRGVLTRDTSITVTGTAAGSQFTSYTLEYADSTGATTSWQTIATGTQPRDDGHGTATLGAWDTTGLLGQYYLRLTVFGLGGVKTSEVNTVFTGVTAGWPKMGDASSFDTNAVVADFDAAASGEEIVYQSNGKLATFHGDGTKLPRVGVASYDYPTLADIDGDGRLEALSAGAQDPNRPERYLFAYRSDGTIPTGFPVQLPALPSYPQTPTTGCPSGLCPGMYEFGGVSAADLNNDGRKEIVLSVGIAKGDATRFGRILMYDNAGTLLTTPLDEEGSAYPTDSPLGGNSISASFGDLDGDGTLEVVAMNDAGFVSAYGANGAPMPGWPKWAGQMPATAIVTADLDGDSRDEVIALNKNWWRVHVWRGDATVYGQSPYGTRGTPLTLAVADIDHDGVLEIVTKTRSYLDVFRRNGVQMDPFPVKMFPNGASGESSAVVATIAPQLNSAQILWTDPTSYKVDATSKNGQSLTDPFPLFLSERPRGQPLIGDVTGDGNTDVVFAVFVDNDTSYRIETKFYLFELGVPASAANSSWPLPYRDPAQTKRATCQGCQANVTKPYDSQVISCDVFPATPTCDRGRGSANAICGTNVCQADCRCTRYLDQTPGWPRLGALWSFTTIMVDDVDADSHPEILNPPYLYRASGAAAEGFPFNEHPDSLMDRFLTTMGDITGDARREIVGPFINYSPLQLGYKVYSNTGAELMTLDVPLAVPNALDVQRTNPVVTDVLPDSPGDEIIGVASRFGQNQGIEMYLWKGDGTLAPGFPAIIPVSVVNYEGVRNFAPAVADMDGDGAKEIVVTFDRTWNAATGRWVDGGVAAIQSDGALLWKKTTADLDQQLPGDHIFLSTPTIGDIDLATPGKEVILTEATYPETAGKVHVLNGTTGAPMAGWPYALGATDYGYVERPIVADIDGDQALEVVTISFTSEGARLSAIEHTGDIKQGWPTQSAYPLGTDAGIFMNPDSLIAADIDGDQKAEIIATGADGDAKVWSFNDDGSIVTAFPMQVPDPWLEIHASPAVADVDEDGKYELLVNSWSGMLFVYQLGDAAQANASLGEWRTGGHDVGHTSASDFDPLPPPAPTNLRRTSSFTVGANDGENPLPVTTASGAIAGATTLARSEVDPGEGGGGGTTKSLTLAWDASTDIQSGIRGYRLYSCSGSSCALTNLNGLGNVTSTTVGAPSGTTLYYEVTAVDRAGNESPRSNRLQVAVP